MSLLYGEILHPFCQFDCIVKAENFVYVPVVECEGDHSRLCGTIGPFVIYVGIGPADSIVRVGAR